jgi:cytochrome c peroxidase
MVGVISAVVVLMAAGFQGPHPVELSMPREWPPMVYDLKANPLTEEGVALGRRMFHDPILSADSTTSCSSCHLSYTAFSHVDHALSHGIHDSIGTRNAPALMNLGWNRTFMWDGAVNHLDVQPLAPINHPAEMGESTAHVVAKMQRSATYRGLFREAFGDTVITGERMLKALAQFQVSLISAGSKYDRVKAGGEVFTEQEAHGYRIFQADCAACHKEPLFTSGDYANNGLPLDSVLRDMGRMRITGDPKDSLRFKVPTLRNIEFSHPYMHDGRFRRLREVIAHYTDGIAHSATLAPELRRPLVLSAAERTDLLAFLLTLSDRDFLLDPDHAAPMN